MNRYVVGKVVRMSVAITRTDTGAAADPTTPTFKIKEPDGTVTTYEYPTNAQLVKDSTGNYHVDWTTDQIGKHYYRFSGSGTTAPGAEESVFEVTASNVI